MASANYTAGTWLGICRSRTVVFLGPGTPSALVQSLWDLLEDAPEVPDVLHAVTSSFGVSLAKIPPFGIVDFRDTLRVFLRGDLDLTVQLPGGPVELHGRDVTTWTERRFDLPEWFRLTAGGNGPGTVLPLTEGVVLVQSLTVAVTASSAEAPDIVVPEPAVTPEPAEPVESAEPRVSAETVMELMDDDSPYGAETAAVERDAQAEPSEVEPIRALEQVQMPADEQTGAYDHLWEKTVIRSVEDAAIRDEPEDSDASAAPQAAGADADAGPDAPVPNSPVPNPPVPSAPLPNLAVPATFRSADVPAPGVGGGMTGGGLIDSVPWRTGGNSVPAPQVPQPVNRSEVPAPATEPSVDPDGFDADHDGQTIMKSDLAGGGASPEPVQQPESGAGPLVLALVCGSGHANPPTHAQCAVCALPLPPDAVQVARPRLGRMRVSTGELVDLDQSLVIGRQPSVSRVQGGVMPRLVQVSSPGGDISRSHVEVRLEGWHVMLCDLKATNGTVLVREGQQPRRLAQNEMAILLDGDIAELGDDISLRFEEIL
jgi:FHA domain